MAEINIRLYKPKYKDDFIRLNTEWITKYFRLEDSDRIALENVEEYIINKGGQVFIAELDGEVVGCCALIAHPQNATYELAKMAVTPDVQGLGIGRRLGEALIAYAQKHGVRRIFLEGNTKMEASIILYKKLGFKEIPKENASYERCDVMMVLDINNPFDYTFIYHI